MPSYAACGHVRILQAVSTQDQTALQPCRAISAARAALQGKQVVSADVPLRLGAPGPILGESSMFRPKNQPVHHMLNEVLSLGGWKSLGPSVQMVGKKSLKGIRGRELAEDLLSARRRVSCFMFDVTADPHNNPLP